MPRVTDSDVKAILATSMDTTPFIQAATLLVDTHLLAAGVPVPLLVEIERWLAAHLASVRSAGVTQKRIGDTDIRYERGEMGQGLMATSYGQQVALLDPTGILAQAMGMKRASFSVF